MTYKQNPMSVGYSMGLKDAGYVEAGTPNEALRQRAETAEYAAQQEHARLVQALNQLQIVEAQLAEARQRAEAAEALNRRQLAEARAEIERLFNHIESVETASGAAEDKLSRIREWAEAPTNSEWLEVNGIDLRSYELAQDHVTAILSDQDTPE